MPLMNDELLKRHYRRATSALAADTDHRLSAAELLALANGQSLAARQLPALQSLARSSSQSSAVQLLAACRDWSTELAAELHAATRPTLVERWQGWWQQVRFAPTLASAAIVLMAIGGARLIHPPAANPPGMAVAPAERALFRGEFEPSDQVFAASLEAAEAPDQLFGGNFDS
jgi:hypothetical protein